LIPIARPLLGEEEKQAVMEVLDSGILAQGPKVAAFEHAFAEYTGRAHGVATSSGTTALHTALLAHGIGPGDEVIIPPITFFASASTVIMCGARPVFADVEEETYNMDPERMAEAVTPKTKAVMPVHMYGQTADMGPILETAEENGLLVVEDACEAHGARYGNRRAGALGDSSCFSFYPTKNITTGEGGMVLSDAEEFAGRCRLIRSHGAGEKYVHETLGYNYRMTEIAAAIGLEQLKKLDAFVAARRRNAAMLTEGLRGIPGITPPREGKDRVHAYYQYIVRVTGDHPLSRDAFVAALNKRGVGCRPAYPIPLNRQKAMVDRGLGASCPVGESLLPQMAELPVHPGVTEEDVGTILKAVRVVSEA
jgi:perosamine synthetase